MTAERFSEDAIGQIDPSIRPSHPPGEHASVGARSADAAIGPPTDGMTPEGVAVGSSRWNDMMYRRHPTPYDGLAGQISAMRVRQIIRAIETHAPGRPFGAIEVGCESGQLLAALAHRFATSNFIGVDVSEAALEDAASRLLTRPNVTLHRGDITGGLNVPHKLRQLDFIICSEVLEHVPDAEAAVRGLARLAQPRTILIVTVPLEIWKARLKHALQKAKLFKLLLSNIEEGPSEWHVHDFSREAVTRLLETEFEVLSYRCVALMHQLIVARKRR